MQSKRIVVIIDALTRGGAQKVLELLIPEWLSSGSVVNLILIQNSNKEIVSTILESDGLTVSRLNARSTLDIRAWWKGTRLVRKFNPDDVQCHLYWSQIWGATFRLFSPRARLVWVEHNVYLARGRGQWLLYSLFSRVVNDLYAVSIEVRDHIVAKTSATVTVIPNPISKDFRLGVKNLEMPTYVFVGRLNRQKNPLLCLSSFKLALEQGSIPQLSRLLVIGEGPLLATLQDFLIENNLSDRIVLLGYLSTYEISNLLTSSVGVISTSDYEGFALVRVEALAAGCTVITTRTAGIKGVLTQDYDESATISGVFLCDATSKHISNALALCLGKEFWTEDSIRERRTRSERFSSRQVADSYLVNFSNTDRKEFKG